METVVVKARYDYGISGTRDRWDVQKGDIGVLKWMPHKRQRRFFEPLVIWDRDPKQKARCIMLSSITIVGLQTQALRVLLHPLSR